MNLLESYALEHTAVVFIYLDSKKDKRVKWIANGSRAIGVYLDGLTMAELDESVWTNDTVRNATSTTRSHGAKLPLVMFSHVAGAFLASYIH